MAKHEFHRIARPSFLRRTLAAVALTATLVTGSIAFAGDFTETEAAEATHSDLTVTESALARGVDDRRPVDPGERFEVGEKIVAFVAVKNRGEESAVTLVWTRDGKRVWDIDLEVGHSSRGWRTWARKTLRTGDVGSWTVTVEAPDGSVLETLEFEVLAEPDARLGAHDGDAATYLGQVGEAITGC